MVANGICSLVWESMTWPKMFESLCLGRMLWCESLASICLVAGIVCAESESVVAVSSSVNIMFLISMNFMLPFSVQR